MYALNAAVRLQANKNSKIETSIFLGPFILYCLTYYIDLEIYGMVKGWIWLWQIFLITFFL